MSCSHNLQGHSASVSYACAMTWAVPGLSRRARFLVQQDVSVGLTPERPEGVGWALGCRQAPRVRIAWSGQGKGTPAGLGA